MNSFFLPSGQGEFRGDVSRDSFEPRRNFTRVFLQQGRVTLDADWNEQTSILLHYLRSLATDLIGPAGGPNDQGFSVTAVFDAGGAVTGDISIGPGRYYVDGILCENPNPLVVAQQAGAPFPDSVVLQASKAYLLFLDVWERHVTNYEASGTPGITDLAEVALGNVDTATRAQTVWQVKVPLLGSDLAGQLGTISNPATKADRKKIDAIVRQILDAFGARRQSLMRARARLADMTDDLCTLSPEGRYRGLENQLYRVEIHQGGVAWDGQAAIDNNTSLFKWSRDNASVCFPVVSLAGDTATVVHLGRDRTRTLEPGDWVEIVDDVSSLRGTPGPLVKVKEVRAEQRQVVLASAVAGLAFDPSSRTHPLLRRWDHAGPIPLVEKNGDAADDWITLEDGVQIQFPPASGNRYLAGDYWLVPARVATGDVVWPRDVAGAPLAVPPHGIEHHYAPLAVVKLDATAKISQVVDLRTVFVPLAQPI